MLKKTLSTALLCLIALLGGLYGSYWAIRNYLTAIEAVATQAGYDTCASGVIAQAKTGIITIGWKEGEQTKQVTLEKCDNQPTKK